MYSESDIEGAVAAGAMTPEAARALRDHVATLRATPAVDEESFRLLTGFNDIFVSIAIVLTLTAVGWIGGSIGGDGTLGVFLGAAAGTGVSWALAEYFTRQRRMALPSIVLLISFVGGIATSLTSVLVANIDAIDRAVPSQYGKIAVASVLGAVIAGLTAGAAWLHWRRFMVPITVAAGAVAVVGVALSLIFGLIPAARDAVYPIVLVAGLAMFAFAMRWDMSDLERRTRRSDVAFWLHLAAAPMIAHALFQMLGVFNAGDLNVVKAAIVLALYVAFAFVALAIDRRALLVSSLVYVLYALYALFTQAGAVELGGALTALVIGSALLTLSAFWQPMRKQVVGLLGDIAGRLPPVQLTAIPRSA